MLYLLEYIGSDAHQAAVHRGCDMASRSFPGPTAGSPMSEPSQSGAWIGSSSSASLQLSPLVVETEVTMCPYLSMHPQDMVGRLKTMLGSRQTHVRSRMVM